MAKPDILFTAGSYAEPAVNVCITTGYSPRKGPLGHEPAVIRITAGYLKTVGEGSGGYVVVRRVHVIGLPESVGHRVLVEV